MVVVVHLHGEAAGPLDEADERVAGEQVHVEVVEDDLERHELPVRRRVRLPEEDGLPLRREVVADPGQEPHRVPGVA